MGKLAHIKHLRDPRSLICVQGGCSVHLVPEHKVEKVKESWINNYYRKKFPDMTDEKLDEAIVVSKPGAGSSVVQIPGWKL